MLFTANSQYVQGERQRTGPTRWPVVVLRDDPGVMPSADVTRLPTFSSQQLSNLQEDSQPLIEFTATVNHHPCQVLVDCGATTDFISEDFVREKGLQTSGNPTDHFVIMGNGKRENCGLTCTVNLKAHGYHTRRTFRVTKLPHHHVILGMPWLSAVNPHLDFQQKICTVKQGLQTIVLGTKPDAHPASGDVLMTAKQLCRAMRKPDTQVLLVLLEPLNERLDLPKETPAAVESLLQDFTDVFPKDLPKGLPPDRGFPHRIELEPGHQPPHKNPYRLSPLELEELRKQLQELIDHDYIQPSKSPYGAPVLFVKKKDGSLRMCVDYRMLNKITVKNKHPLPRIDELLDQLSGARYFSKLDLRSGYWQVPVAAEDTVKTAFKTRYGLFEFKVMPFGLTNAPATFQAMMNHVLAPFVDKFVANILDDILIYSKTLEEHVEHLRQVLEKLREFKLYAKLSKCEFAKPEVEFVGFTVGKDGLKASPSKLAAVRDWPEPKSVKDIRSFLGFCNFYRRFVKNYAYIAAPLTELTKRDVWSGALGPEEKAAFQELKDQLTSAPVLLNPDFSKPFVVHVDACDFAIGAVLLQDQGQGLQPVAYESKKLSETERRWIISEKEAFALVHACRVWRHYLESNLAFLVRTDNSPVSFLLSKPVLTRKQARWVEELAQFNFTVEHIKGTENFADALSRRPDLLNILSTARTHQLTTSLLQDITAAYWQDPWFFDPANRAQLEFKNSLWYKDGKVVLPADVKLKSAVLAELHDCPLAAHRGVEKTKERIRRHFWWPTLSADVEEYVSTCPNCQRNKPANQRKPGLLQPIPAPTQRWEHVTMDLITHLPTTASGNDSFMWWWIG
jgi:hypothetical protein